MANSMLSYPFWKLWSLKTFDAAWTCSPIWRKISFLSWNLEEDNHEERPNCLLKDDENIPKERFSAKPVPNLVTCHSRRHCVYVYTFIIERKSSDPHLILVHHHEAQTVGSDPELQHKLVAERMVQQQRTPFSSVNRALTVSEESSHGKLSWPQLCSHDFKLCLL